MFLKLTFLEGKARRKLIFDRTPPRTLYVFSDRMFCAKNGAFDAMREMGIWFTGGEHSPYIWLKCPNNMGSWEFFDLLLEKANVVGTPGAGFGVNGEGFFRLTAFGDRENTKEAVARMKKLLAEL